MRSLQSQKLEIAKLVLGTENKSVLMQIKTIFESEKIDFWDELPQTIKEDVNEALLQSKKGMGKSHKTVMKKYKKWLAK